MTKPLQWWVHRRRLTAGLRRAFESLYSWRPSGALMVSILALLVSASTYYWTFLRIERQLDVSYARAGARDGKYQLRLIVVNSGNRDAAVLAAGFYTVSDQPRTSVVSPFVSEEDYMVEPVVIPGGSIEIIPVQFDTVRIDAMSEKTPFVLLALSLTTMDDQGERFRSSWLVGSVRLVERPAPDGGTTKSFLTYWVDRQVSGFSDTDEAGDFEGFPPIPLGENADKKDPANR